MIIRIVKLSFEPGFTADFREIFAASEPLIRNFPGCKALRLMIDDADTNVFYTYSVWESGENLELYRKSELFLSVWKKVKQGFREPAQAFSMAEVPEQKG